MKQHTPKLKKNIYKFYFPFPLIYFLSPAAFMSNTKGIASHWCCIRKIIPKGKTNQLIVRRKKNEKSSPKMYRFFIYLFIVEFKCSVQFVLCLPIRHNSSVHKKPSAFLFSFLFSIFQFFTFISMIFTLIKSFKSRDSISYLNLFIPFDFGFNAFSVDLVLWFILFQFKRDCADATNSISHFFSVF